MRQIFRHSQGCLNRGFDGGVQLSDLMCSRSGSSCHHLNEGASIEQPAPDTLARHNRRRDADPSPETQTHFKPFRSEKDLRIITKTTSLLETCGFYWGPMTVEEAHLILKDEPLGTFLIRDSKQKDIFFTLSYRASSGPTNIRINFQNSRFNLVGSKASFDSLFKLLEHYIASPKKSLIRPHRESNYKPYKNFAAKRLLKHAEERK
ncbi:hypothetical protein GJAV_G00262510 [Gymnothorax javanicus]|nr:hypothetical protein GJAV_G00262510 [Gymnothorax javanicus]